MKKAYTLSFLFAAFTSASFAQTNTFDSHFSNVRSELVKWDPIRGEWLAQSMVNMANNKPTPDRNFPEEFTPAEMFNAMPAETQRAVRNEISQGSRTHANDSIENKQWNRVNRFVSRTPSCKAVMGRTYGDPHLSSFDNATYSFQTVGEFTLVESGSGHMKVQVRQRNQGDNFSLNTATAMYVDGDRVGFYANEKPDGNSTTPLRVGGEAIYIDNGSTYYLEHGGTITKSKNDYVVTWPTGEKVQLDFRQTGGMGFMNIAVQVFPCTDTYDGILGNANGNSRDDYNPRGTTSRMTWNTGVFGSTNRTEQELEKEYLAYLAKDFARSYRLTPEISLFDYGFNQSTFSFTDESFPRVHHTIGDLSNDDMARARRSCERQGFTGAELSACIYDQGFLRIEPTPKPNIPDRTAGRVLRPVTAPTPNVNPGQKPYAERYPEGKNPTINGTGNTGGGAHPITKNPGDIQSEKSPSNGASEVNQTRPTTIGGTGSEKSPADKKPVDNTPIGTKTPEPNLNTSPNSATGSTVKNPSTTQTSNPSTGSTVKQPSTSSTPSTTTNSNSTPRPVINTGTIFNSGSKGSGNGSSGGSTPVKSPSSTPTSTPRTTPTVSPRRGG